MSTPPQQQAFKNKTKRSPRVDDLVPTEVWATMEKKYLLSESALDLMISGYSSIMQVVFGALLGVASVFWSLWSSCNAEPTKRYYLDWATMSSGLSALCLILCVSGWWRTFKIKKNLKDNAVKLEP